MSMFLCAWTVNHGSNNITDHFALFDTEEQADNCVADIFDTAHTWAITKVISASEPHWHEEPAEIVLSNGMTVATAGDGSFAGEVVA